MHRLIEKHMLNCLKNYIHLHERRLSAIVRLVKNNESNKSGPSPQNRRILKAKVSIKNQKNFIKLENKRPILNDKRLFKISVALLLCLIIELGLVSFIETEKRKTIGKKMYELVGLNRVNMMRSFLNSSPQPEKLKDNSQVDELEKQRLFGEALICFEQGRFDKGVEYIKRYIALNDRETVETLVYNFFNAALEFAEKRMFDKAVDFLKISLEIQYEVKPLDEISISNTLNEIGHVYRQLRNFSEALKHFNEALEHHNRLKYLKKREYSE